MGELEDVTIIVPCRDEVDYIGDCLASIRANCYPKERLEVLVVDGMSQDGTREVIDRFARENPFVRMIDNPKRTAPAALNIGISQARGQVILRMDAHNVYPEHYVPRLVKWLAESGADNVGGVCVTKPGGQGLVAKAIATALSHPFGVGNSHFRIGTVEPRWVDTVPFGCFRKEVFGKVGLFDEELVRNQDDEFNLRLIRKGGRILLVPDVSSDYFARGTLGKLSRMFVQYGYYKPLVARKVGSILTIRQLVPAAFIMTLAGAGIAGIWSIPLRYGFAGLAISYGMAALICAVIVSFRQGLGHAVFLPLAFATLHFSYGLGFLKGVVDFLVLRRRAGPKPDEAISR